MDSASKDKHDLLNKLLGEGDAMVCLDARPPEVMVPKNHKDNPVLNLVLNLGFRRPIEVEEDGIYATLSFGGRPQKCFLPFTAIWAIYEPDTQKGQVWEESIPEDIDLEARLKQDASTAPRTLPRATPPKADAPPKPKRDRSHLRVIK